MPGPWIQAPRGLALSDRPLVFASNATAVALAGGRSCEYARRPWTPDTFWRLTPQVSGLRPALDVFCGSFPSMEGWTAKPDGVVLLLVAPAKHGVVCGSGWQHFGDKTRGKGLVFGVTQQSEPS